VFSTPEEVAAAFDFFGASASPPQPGNTIKERTAREKIVE
jgi:hypothetical protein